MQEHDKRIMLPADLHRRLLVLKAAHGLRSLAEAVAALELAARGEGPLHGRMHAFAADNGRTPEKADNGR